MVTRPSPWSVDGTVTRLSTVIAARGLKLFAVIDHSAEARTVGLQLRDTRLIVFGSPRAGTPIMSSVPVAALDLPLKVLVWADGGETWVSYIEGAELAARYHLSPGLAAPLSVVVPIVDAAVDH